MKKLTQEGFLERARSIHGDFYDYSKTIYVNKRTHVTIICPIHGEFLQIPFSHYNGCGCQKCGNISQAKKLSVPHYDFKEFTKRAGEKHKWKYKYVDDGNYNGVKSKVHILCSVCGNEFYQQANDHLTGKGCPACKARQSSIRKKGKPQNAQRKIIFGVGINDYDGSTNNLRSYRIWHEMISRCYGSRGQERRPTYKDCDVCEEWLRFSSYKKWYDENFIDGFDVDKDLLSHVDEKKMYSPRNCVFLPPEINGFLVRKKTADGKMIGVHLYGTSYIVTCGSKYLGSFKNRDDAIQVYKEEKKRQAVSLAEKWRDKIDIRAYKALMGLDIEQFFNIK